jgi:hypothetical protein
MRKKKSLIIRKEENPFKPGDVGFIGLGAVSRKSMAFWVSKKEILACPCHWRRRYVVILKIVGEYCFASLKDDPQAISAFYFKDIKLVKRMENDSTKKTDS